MEPSSPLVNPLDLFERQRRLDAENGGAENSADVVETDLAEVVNLAAIDSEFYSRHFFPKAARQESPPMHRDVWDILESPNDRYVAVKMARDFAKTTLLRLFCSKRIAYTISRTILYVGKSETSAMKSIDWLRRAVEFNEPWAKTFGLRKGTQWSGSEIDIYSEPENISIRVIAIGITGSTRGINVDDYRPDLIIVDDPCDEENTATPEQREKISNLFFGALYNSLAPATDSPEAKMVLLQTPLDSEDLIESCKTYPGWTYLEFSCFNEAGESNWPSRYPTVDLLREKAQATARGMLNIWLREKEVTVVSDELAYFSEYCPPPFWDLLPSGGRHYICIDPTPPPKENETMVRRTCKLDDFVIQVLKLYQGKIYVVTEYVAKSPQPTEWIAAYFGFLVQYKPMCTGCETTLFQRMVKWVLDQEMRKRQIFNTIFPIEDRRRKQTRIQQTLSGRLSTRSIVFGRSQTTLVEQVNKYPMVTHDDHVDCLAIGCALIEQNAFGLENGLDDYIDGEYTDLTDDWRGAP